MELFIILYKKEGGEKKSGTSVKAPGNKDSFMHWKSTAIADTQVTQDAMGRPASEGCRVMRPNCRN